jgi:putative transposase
VLEVFREEYGSKYPKAVAKLDRDWIQLTAFYDYPAEHWRHLRTTNPIESAVATVRLRTRVTNGERQPRRNDGREGRRLMIVHCPIHNI